MEPLSTARSGAAAAREGQGRRDIRKIAPARIRPAKGGTQRANDKDIAAYYDFMKKWNPQDNPQDFYATVSYVNANMQKHLLEKCGDDLTRQNLSEAGLGHP